MRDALAIGAAVSMLLVVPSTAAGHGGGLDRNGCHTNRKTGEYHCHGAAAAPPAAKPSPAPVSARSVAVHASATTSDRDLIRAAQILLHALGYAPSLLGSADARTQAAVRTFQRAENLSATGTIDEYLLVRLATKVAAKCP
jgi:Putative peptidoglycan binding domain